MKRLKNKELKMMENKELLMYLAGAGAGILGIGIFNTINNYFNLNTNISEMGIFIGLFLIVISFSTLKKLKNESEYNKPIKQTLKNEKFTR